MEFCNKGMVRADPPPPVMVKDHKFTFIFGPFPNPCFESEDYRKESSLGQCRV